MMKKRGWKHQYGRVGAALVVLGLGACASAGRGTPIGDTILIVQNNLTPSATVAISASPGGGAERDLGTVPPSTTDTLRFNALGSTGPYEFVAEIVGGGGQVSSSALVVFPGSVVEWNLISNLLTVTDAN